MEKIYTCSNGSPAFSKTTGIMISAIVDAHVRSVRQMEGGEGEG